MPDFKFKDSKDTRKSPPHYIADNSLIVDGKIIPYKNNAPYGHEEEFDNNIRTISFVELMAQDPWEFLKVKMTVRLDSEYHVNDLSENIHSDEELMLIVEWNCKQSRFINKETYEFNSEGTSVEFSIDRTEIYIKTDIKVYAVIKNEYDYDSGNYAVKKGSVVATSPVFNIQTDPIDPNWGGGIREEWVTFKDENEVDSLFKIKYEINEENDQLVSVILWNKRNKKLKLLLEDINASGNKYAALRDVIAELCGVIAVSQLVSGIDWKRYEGEAGDDLSHKVFGALKGMTGIRRGEELYEEIKSFRAMEDSVLISRIFHKLKTAKKIEDLISMQDTEEQ